MSSTLNKQRGRRAGRADKAEQNHRSSEKLQPALRLAFARCRRLRGRPGSLWVPGTNFKGLADCCFFFFPPPFPESSIAALLHPPDRPLQNIDHGSGAAKVVERRASKMGLSFTRWRRPLTIVSAHVDFQLSATRQPPPSLPPSLPPSSPMGAGGGWGGWMGGWRGAKNRATSSLQRGADSACSPSLRLTGSQAEPRPL